MELLPVACARPANICAKAAFWLPPHSTVDARRRRASICPQATS
jgi:hypothetical protein